MKFAVLSFSYANAKNFARSVADRGFFSMNLGDYMQTLAGRRLLSESGITDVVTIDRDTMAEYAGEPVTVLMSAVFFPWSFPIPPSIRPIFIGFQAAENVIKANAEYFKRHEPIGCRDDDTTELFKKYAIAAHTTGCVTITFERRASPPVDGKVLIICGGGAGSFPAEALRFMPPHLASRAEFVFQRQIVHQHPLTQAQQIAAERYTKELLTDYRARADLVVTALHHATTPCISSGIPVVLCRKAMDTRFSLLRKIMPIYTPESFAAIDWSPIIPDTTDMANRVRAALRERLSVLTAA